MSKGITKRQKIKIWTMRHALEMPEKELRDLVECVSYQRSTRELTRQQAKRLIDALEGKKPMPKTIGSKKCRFGKRATLLQLSLIAELKEEAGWDDEHLRNFLLKYYKVSMPDELDVKRAGKLIDVLKREKAKGTYVIS